MNHQLSFGKIIILNDNIAEVIVDHNVEMTLEMVEECDEFFAKHFSENFGLLVNKINTYKYTYEATLIMGTSELLKAVAIVNYHSSSVVQSNRIASVREADNLNFKNFSGLDLGWQQGYDWLKKELSVLNQ